MKETWMTGFFYLLPRTPKLKAGQNIFIREKED
jgi:hypothetical protein